MPLRTKWDKVHMRAATLYSELSSAKRLKVGCVIVKDNRIVSIGYNGMPSGWDNNCEYRFGKYELDTELKTKKEVLHAETNAIAKIARSNESAEDSTLYTTHAPCLDCAKLIYQSGITKVFYLDEYRTNEGLLFLGKCGIMIKQL